MLTSKNGKNNCRWGERIVVVDQLSVQLREIHGKKFFLSPYYSGFWNAEQVYSLTSSRDKKVNMGEAITEKPALPKLPAFNTVFYLIYRQVIGNLDEII